jgi:AcrR family transcriptional regulator
MPSRGADPTRPQLSRDRVVHTAVDLADEAGITAVTIRALADRLQVKPMSIYHYVANKEAILDAISDLVVEQIDVPAPTADWEPEIRRWATSARHTLVKHPWAITLMQSRLTPGPATLRHHDAVIGTLRHAGFPLPLVGHAFATLDSYIHGFALQESTLPFDRDTVADQADTFLSHFPAETYPHLADFTVNHVLRPGYDFAAEFDFGLNLILTSLSHLNPTR